MTRTSGLVYSPHYAEGLNVSLDYYNIRLTNAIAAVDTSEIINFCYVQNVSSFCDRFSRNGAGVIRSPNESLTNLNTEEGPYRVRSNLQLDWSYKQFGASWTVRYDS